MNFNWRIIFYLKTWKKCVTGKTSKPNAQKEKLWWCNMPTMAAWIWEGESKTYNESFNLSLDCSVTFRILRMRKVLFSQVCLSTRGYPSPRFFAISGPRPFRGYPSSTWGATQVLAGVNQPSAGSASRLLLLLLPLILLPRTYLFIKFCCWELPQQQVYLSPRKFSATEFYEQVCSR